MASPQQNGAHERFHRTLKGETGKPPAGDRTAQQRRFSRFRTVYDDERPHEALGQTTPASRWKHSPRAYPTLAPIRRRAAVLEQRLAGGRIGMEETDDGIWTVYSCIARYDERRSNYTDDALPMLPV